MSASVIMVSCGSDAMLFASVASVLSQDGLDELIVVDNGNAPDIFARLQQISLSNPKLVIISGHGNGGVAAGYNLGVKRATALHMVLLSADCLMSGGALTRLTQMLVSTPGGMVSVPLLVNADGSDAAFRREFFIPESYMAPACLCIKKADYETLGGMDERFKEYAYDMDFMARVSDAGGRIVTLSDIRVAHMHVGQRISEKHKANTLKLYLEKHHKNGFIGQLPLMKIIFAAQETWRGLFKASLTGSGKEQRASKRLRVLAGSYTDSFSLPGLAGRTVLVTGATSQVGLFVVKRLLMSGAAVLALSREDSVQFTHAHLRWIKGDLTDEALHLNGYAVDYAVHAAQLWLLPAIIPLLANAGVARVVGVGSVSRFSRLASKNGNDQRIVQRLIAAENQVEKEAASHQLSWTILRPTLIYGIGVDEHISQMARVIKKFGRFPVYPPAFGRRQPVHADDVALATLEALLSPQAANKAYNISGGEVLTYTEMLERIFKALGQKTRIVKTTMLPFLMTVAGMLTRKSYLNAEVAHRMNDDLVFFHDDAARDFGYNPRAFLNGGRKDLEG